MIVFDVDGVLADPTHRLKYIQGQHPDWEKFFEESKDDAPIRAGLRLLLLHLRSTHRVELWTGRSDRYRLMLESWLLRFGMPRLPQIAMRPHGDHCPDVELKRRWVEEAGPENIELVFEDRSRFVDMYRSYGIVCYQTAPGEF